MWHWRRGRRRDSHRRRIFGGMGESVDPTDNRACHVEEPEAGAPGEGGTCGIVGREAGALVHLPSLALDVRMDGGYIN